jgi:Domain of Unknown Function (DUF928)
VKQILLSSTLGILALLAGTVELKAAYAIPFSPPGDSGLPRTSTGGASRGGFIPPADNSLPRTSTGGASRGSFIPPTDNSLPRTSTGGASRDGFIPPADNSLPRTSTGGASRDGFVPPSDNATPHQTTGGASREGFLPPPGNPAPRMTVGGASRTNLYGYLPSQAGSPALPMLAVTPQSFYGTTLAAHPTILVYVPSSNAQDAVFSLKDEAGNTLYQTLVAVPDGAGVVAIQLPEAAPALEADKNYQWFFALMIDGTLSPSTPYVDAWIKRIQPDAALAQALQQGDAHKQADILAAKGVWYDSVAMLADLRMVQPADATLTADWHELLDSVGLGEVSTVDSNSIK